MSLDEPQRILEHLLNRMGSSYPRARLLGSKPPVSRGTAEAGIKPLKYPGEKGAPATGAFRHLLGAYSPQSLPAAGGGPNKAREKLGGEMKGQTRETSNQDAQSFP